jgi:hypothetical protein
MRKEVGRIEKGKATIIEYEAGSYGDNPNYFVQVGIVGLWLEPKELKDLMTALNYYNNIEEYAQCRIKVDGEYVAAP